MASVPFEIFEDENGKKHAFPHRDIMSRLLIESICPQELIEHNSLNSSERRTLRLYREKLEKGDILAMNNILIKIHNLLGKMRYETIVKETKSLANVREFLSQLMKISKELEKKKQHATNINC